MATLNKTNRWVQSGAGMYNIHNPNIPGLDPDGKKNIENAKKKQTVKKTPKKKGEK